MIVRALGLKPEEFVYLGDTNVDMRTALNAGMHPVGVTWGFRPAEELAQAGAEHLIGNPLDLLQLVTES